MYYEGGKRSMYAGVEYRHANRGQPYTSRRLSKRLDAASAKCSGGRSMSTKERKKPEFYCFQLLGGFPERTRVSCLMRSLLPLWKRSNKGIAFISKKGICFVQGC